LLVFHENRDFEGSLITNPLSDFQNSKWWIQYVGRKFWKIYISCENWKGFLKGLTDNEFVCQIHEIQNDGFNIVDISFKKFIII